MTWMRAICLRRQLLLLVQLLLLLLMSVASHDPFDKVASGPIIPPPLEYTIEHFLRMAERQQHVVLDAWLLQKDAVNPSIIVHPCHAHRLIVVWRIWDKRRHDKMGYMWMDPRTWTVTKSKDFVENIDPGKLRVNLIGEDARIFSHNGKLHLTFSTHLQHLKKVYMAEVFYAMQGDIFYILHPAENMLLQQPQLNDQLKAVTVEQRHEKNWIPFEYCPRCVFERGYVAPYESGHHRSQLLFVYSIQPHVIVNTFPSDAKGERIAQCVFKSKLTLPFQWKWGEMRGGTPALRLGNHYLSFFHSSGHFNWKFTTTYVMGAYLFQSEPPFAITHMSAEPVMHETFVNETWGWAWRTVDYVIFPMGFTFDEDHIYVSYGRNDKDSWIVKLSRSELLRNLVPVETEVIGVSDYDADSGVIQPGTYRRINASYSDNHQC